MEGSDATLYSIRKQRSGAAHNVASEWFAVYCINIWFLNRINYSHKGTKICRLNVKFCECRRGRKNIEEQKRKAEQNGKQQRFKDESK